MPTNEEEIEVAIYCDNKSDYDLAVKTLNEADPTQQIRVYDGVVEGRVTRDKISALRTQGLFVDPLSAQTASQPESVEADSVEGAQPESASFAIMADEAEAQPTLAAETLNAPGRASSEAWPKTFRRSDRSDPDMKRQIDRFQEKANSTSAREIKSMAQDYADRPVSPDVGPSPQSVPDSSFNFEGISADSDVVGHENEDVYKVRLRGPMRPEWRAAFDRDGIEISSFEPPNSYRMFLTEQQLEQTRGFSFVEGVERYSMADTVTPDLLSALKASEQATSPIDDPTAPVAPEILSSTDPSATLPETFEVVCHRASDLPKVLSVIEGVDGAEVIDQSDDTIRFKAALESPLLAALADLTEVKSIAPYRPPTLFANMCRTLIGIKAVNEGAAEQWTGEVEVIGVFDSGIDSNHPDFVGRIKETVSFRSAPAIDRVGHGTHVAGIIAGTGASSVDEKICGVAPGAELVVIGIVKEDRTLEL